MWLHLERIWMAFLTVLVIYLLTYAVLILCHLVNKKIVSVQKLKSIRKAMGRLAPFVLIIIILAYVCTLNVPINFMVIFLIFLIFWRPIKNLSYGLLLPLYRKLEVGDEINLNGDAVYIEELGNVGIKGQGNNGQIFLNYDNIIENNLSVIKNKYSLHLVKLELQSPEGLHIENVKANLFEILSNQSLIDHGRLPRIVSLDANDTFSLEVFMKAESDPEDLIALLIEKSYKIINS